jgi:hypothetical protein
MKAYTRDLSPFVCVDKLQEMHSSETISGNDGPVILRHDTGCHYPV